MKHLYIKSAFTTEQYKHDQPVYVLQLPHADRSLTYPQRPIARLRLNLYGTKTACHTYHSGRHTHLIQPGFHTAECDPCKYICSTHTGTTVAAVTIDDFLLVSQTAELISQYIYILKRNYTVTELSRPAVYLGWTITTAEDVSIHAAQPNLIAKTLVRGSLTDTNKRQSYLPKQP